MRASESRPSRVFVAISAVAAVATGMCARHHDASAPSLDAGPAAAPLVAVTTGSYDVARTGANTRELGLAASTVNVDHFGKLFSRDVDGDLYAQPLYVPNVAIANHPNVVYVATQHDSIYAYDADDPAANQPLWKVSLGLSTPIPNPYFAVPADQRCTMEQYNLKETGITSTPVIDLETGTLYAVAMVQDPTQMRSGQTCTGIDPHGANFCKPYPCDAPSFRLELHALDITSGAERPNSPVTLSATAKGSGAGSVDGVVTLDATLALQRPALLLSHGSLYIGLGSYGNIGAHHGWILRYDPSSLAQQSSFIVTPNALGGSIWQSGHGISADADGNVYVMSGNGNFSASRGGSDFGDSFLKFDPALSLTDWFAPALDDADGNDYLAQDDQDLGSSGPVVLPDSNFVVGGGKQGILYVLPRNALGHLETDGGGAGEAFRATWRFFKTTCADAIIESNIHGSPVYWNGPDGPTLYVWGEQDYLKAYKIADGRVATAGLCFCTGKESFLRPGQPPNPNCGVPSASSSTPILGAMPGGILSLSANDKVRGSGIVWATHALGRDDPTHATVAGVLEAYDASDVSKLLWDSTQNEARDGIGSFAKFTPPTVANGKVYLATSSRKLLVFGPLP